MATIPKLLKSAPRMRGVTPVPNGPLVKKKGTMKGSTLQRGGTVKKAQLGETIRPTADSTAYYGNLSDKKYEVGKSLVGKDNEKAAKFFTEGTSAYAAKLRQSKKGKPGYDKNGFPLKGTPLKRDKIKKARTGAWQRKEGKNPEGGLNAKGVASYRAEHPGSKLKTAVTTKPSKLKPGSKSANRRKSFCARMSGMKKRLTSAKTANDPNSRINKSLRKWNC